MRHLWLLDLIEQDARVASARLQEDFEPAGSIYGRANQAANLRGDDQ